MKLTKNADPDKYRYSGLGTGFDACAQLLWSDGSCYFWCGYELILHVDNNKKGHLVFGERVTQRLLHVKKIRS